LRNVYVQELYVASTKTAPGCYLQSVLGLEFGGILFKFEPYLLHESLSSEIAAKKEPEEL